MKTQTNDYYATLGLTPDASLADIKKAYRKLARTHHPDKNPGDPHAAERFRELTEAYDTLTDPDQRAAYDQDYQPHQAAPLPRQRPTPTSSASSCGSWKPSG